MAAGAERAFDEALEADPLAAGSGILAGAIAAPRDDCERRLAAGMYALGGCDRALAATADPSLLVCSTADEARRRLDASGDEIRSHDELCAAVTLGWSGDVKGTYALMRSASDRAMREGRLVISVGVLERFAHHAVIFGETSLARQTIDEAIERAKEPRLWRWGVRCRAIAARLAVDTGDPASAFQYLHQAGSQEVPAALLALLAPPALRAGDASDGDAAPLESAELLELALRCDAAEAAAAAAAALLIAGGKPLEAGGPAVAAVRRTLRAVESASVAAELFSLAARYAPAADARFAVAALRAAREPDRRYVEAHLLLACAYTELRFGKRSAAVDSASDAARAFDALGHRYWTNEAMLVLVQRERGSDAPTRRRPSALSLTEREQQVAHLVRRGASNREVASALQISEHTVERHVSSILSRLGLRSRWQIVDAGTVATQR